VFFKGEEDAGLKMEQLETKQLEAIRGIMVNWGSSMRDLRIMFRDNCEEWILKLINAKGGDKGFVEEGIKRMICE
jgi:hypothetical protein